MADDRPTFGSLFAGIGGIDLGLERAGWRGRWQVEWDPFCQRVLAKHWPDIQRYGDITAVDWSGVERVDLLAGGFPCQPVSGAGKGEAQADERWLWPEFLRAIRALRPELVLVENVTNLLAVNGGSAFGDVLGDLAASGYDAEWDCIPASAVGALHERDRVWIVAYAGRGGVQSDRRSDEARRAPEAIEVEAWERQRRRDATGDGRSDAGQIPDSASNGRRPGRTWGSAGGGQGQAERAHGPMADAKRRDGEAFHQGGVLGASGRGWSAVRSADGRLSGYGRWLPEPDVGRVAHGVPSRVDRLRSLGNAVVPQVVEVIGRQLLASIERAA